MGDEDRLTLMGGTNITRSKLLDYRREVAVDRLVALTGRRRKVH